MELSRRLENISSELQELNEIAQAQLDTTIVYVVETGKILKDYEKKVQDVLDTQEGHYDHRPRKFINIYPNITAVTSVLLQERSDNYTYGNRVR